MIDRDELAAKIFAAIISGTIAAQVWEPGGANAKRLARSAYAWADVFLTEQIAQVKTRSL
jgi:hypothetical protein